MAESANHYHYARGRRKEAIATARLYSGKGEILVNDQPAATYFNNDSLIAVVEAPAQAGRPRPEAAHYATCFGWRQGRSGRCG